MKLVMTKEHLLTMDVLLLALSRQMDIAISLKNQIYVIFVATGLENHQSPVMILIKQMTEDALLIVRQNCQHSIAQEETQLLLIHALRYVAMGR